MFFTFYPMILLIHFLILIVFLWILLGFSLWVHKYINSLFFKKILFIYLTERKCERAQEGGAAEAEGETDCPLSRKPNTGLDPRTLRTWPEPKADAQPTEPPTPQYPKYIISYYFILFSFLIDLSRISNTMLSRSDDSWHPCFLGEDFQHFIVKYDVCFRIFICNFYQIKDIIFYS